MDRIAFSNLLSRINLAIISAFLFIFPVYFLLPGVATEAFVLPRQILTVIVVSVITALWGARSVLEKKVIIRNTPFNVPLTVFGGVILLSSLLAQNMYDSLAATIPLLAVLFLFGQIVLTIYDKNSFGVVLASFMLGALFSSIITILSYLKIYILPFTATQNQFFNTFGSPIQQIGYLLPIFALSLFMLLAHKAYKKIGTDYSSMINALVLLTTIAGLVFLVYEIMVSPQKPQILPISSGFQIATATVSDSNRLLVSLPFGSGYGTFLPDYTRFKLASLNNNPNIWGLNFSYSSTYVLEILTTTGILGMLAFFYLVSRLFRTRESTFSPIFISCLVVFGLAFLIPFSFPLVVLLFVLLALYTSFLYVSGDRRVYDIILSLVALRHGLLSFDEEGHRRKTEGSILPSIILAVILIVFGTATYAAVKLSTADYYMAQSVSPNNQSNGQRVYDLQRSAISTFPYRSDYFRIFSQLNLGLASSVSNNIQKGQKPSAETQKLVTDLLQQSIANARYAITLSPITALNWENLAQVYRNLINVGQNADEFAISAQSQAIALDPYNPLLRIELGGIYYQIGQYDRAEDQFKTAIQLKPDLANAYYNLGHTLEAKGELEAALTQYETVMRLLNNEEDRDKLEKEISALKTKIASGGETKPTGSASGSSNQPPLELSNPSNPLPTQTEQVKISPPPTGTPKATPTP